MVAVQSSAVVEQLAFAGGYVNGKEVVLDVSTFGRENDGTLFGHVESHEVDDHPVAVGQLFQLFTLSVEQVEVVKTVFLALQDEFLAVPRQEGDGGDGMHLSSR